MQYLYNLTIFFVRGLIKLAAVFNPKMKLFVSGRKSVFQTINEKISNSDAVFWVHCASLGEFEQGRPVVEKLKKNYPSHKVVLTFFSPSGYEVQKNYEHADVVVYLPIDTVSNAKKFIRQVHPSVAIFVKYEFWPNLLDELAKQQVPTLLVSGIFRKDQIFFKSYGLWLRSKLATFSHFFVQDAASADLLSSINLKNATVSGDTRFDRVFDILERDNNLDFINDFVGESYVLVAGSTWKEDEDLLVDYIMTKAKENEKFIIAPHNIKSEAIQNLKSSLGNNAVIYSEKDGVDLSSFQVFIIDTVGLLTKIYSKANVAYVGGGYTKSGVHNVLEPATFGIPVVIGPNFVKFKEAQDLVHLQGCFVTDNQEKVNSVLTRFRDDIEYRLKTGEIAQQYIKSSLGASEKICNYIDSILD